MADNNVSGTHDSLNPERDPLALARSFCQRVPHSRDLGMTIVPTEGRHAHMRLMPQPHLLDDAGAKTLCSSAVLSLVDSAAGLAVFAATRSLIPIATLDLRMNYLRPAPCDLAMEVSADCVAFTDDVGFVHCVVYTEGHPHPMATGDATFMSGTRVRRFDAGPPPEPMPATSSEATSRTALADKTDNTARSYADYVGLEVLAGNDGLQLRLPHHDELIGNFLLPALPWSSARRAHRRGGACCRQGRPEGNTRGTHPQLQHRLPPPSTADGHLCLGQDCAPYPTNNAGRRRLLAVQGMQPGCDLARADFVGIVCCRRKPTGCGHQSEMRPADASFPVRGPYEI